MATVSATITVDRPPEAVWELYFDPQRWAAWVDQFSSLVSLGPAYPSAGAQLVWRSGTAGRGEVREQVLEHDPPRRHRIEFSDPASRGELTTTFAGDGDSTSVTLEMAYELASTGVFARVSDLLFVRSQMKSSLARSLEGLRAEASGR
jgi:uncharacterized protein YndB with AHSA1/START domain